MTTKRMLEEAFPGITVTLANHPPPLIKRLMGIVIPILQGGVIVIIMGGEQIFQKLGYMKPPPWYYSLRANRHGTIITTWFLGNYIKSCLKNSGAFEVFSDGELVKFLLWKIHSSFLFFVSELWFGIYVAFKIKQKHNSFRQAFVFSVCGWSWCIFF